MILSWRSMQDYEFRITISHGKFIMSYKAWGPMKNAGKGVDVTWQPMGGWGSVLGEGFWWWHDWGGEVVMVSSFGE